LLVLQLFMVRLLPGQVAAEEKQLKSPQQTSDQAKDTEEIGKVLRPFLWKIDGDKPSYLFGTIHVTDDRVLAMHPTAKQAFEESDSLFLEVTPQDTIKQLQTLVLPFDVKLENELDAETLERLDKQLAALNPLYAGRHRPNFKIWAWPLMLPSLKAQLKHPTREILDFKLAMLAMERGQRVHSLEDPLKQMVGLEQLSKEEQILFLRDTLTSMEAAEEDEIDYEAEVTEMYLRGDDEALKAFFDEEMASEELPEELSKKIVGALLDDRNVIMAETIALTLKNHPDKSHFFAAGTAHFIGPHSVQNVLKTKGIVAVRVETPTEE
jgi:uncharacterized protein YbaP (TraB family)